MNSDPRVSVGLPVYNSERYVAASIEALLGQTFTDFELIISDNASTDSTSDICREYAKSDKRIRFIQQRKNVGLAPNHNIVRDEARGEFFKWAAADDLYGRELLQVCVAALDRYPEVLLAHAYEGVVDVEGRVTQAMKYPLATDASRPSERFRSFLFGSSGLFASTDAAHPGMVRVDYDGILSFCDEYGVIRTEAMRSVKPLGSYHHSDRIVVCELLLRGKFHITPEWLYFRRDTTDRSYNVSSKLRQRCENLGSDTQEPSETPDSPPGRGVCARLRPSDPAGADLRGREACMLWLADSMGHGPGDEEGVYRPSGFEGRPARRG